MAGSSLLGYRVYRLRRLIAVCLGLVAAGIGLGLWLIPGPVTALQIVLGVGVFSILAVAHLAMILIWPVDARGPLSYAIGAMIMLTIALPAGAHQLATGTEAATLLVIAVMLGPFLWLAGAPFLGDLTLVLINKLLPTKRRQVRVFDLPLDLPRAMALFALDPDKKRVLSEHGPLNWDNSFEEKVTRLVADPQTGVLRSENAVNRFQVLDTGATTRSLMVATRLETGGTFSVVIHQEFTPHAKGTRLIERLDIEGAPGVRLFFAWLSDNAADYVTAELDAEAGRPPRAIEYLPQDSMGLAMIRFFKWGDPPPG